MRATLSKTADWRWARVLALHKEERQASRGLDDKYTKEAFRFEKRRQKANSSTSMLRLEKDYPEISIASALYEELMGPRWFIEAGVMGNVSREEMSDYFGTSVKMLEYYEKLFFDVRDKLNNKGYILSRVLLPALSNGVAGYDCDMMWKLLSYFGHWDSVQSFWDSGEMSVGAKDFLDGDIKSRMVKNAFIAVNTLQINQYTATDVIQQYLELKRMEQESSQGGVRGQAAEHLGVLLDSMTVTVASGANIILPAREPRAVEMMGTPVLIETGANNGKT